MSPADKVIQKCGGVPETARLAGCSENWVYRWRLPKEKGGTGGLVPQSAQIALLMSARKGAVDISPDDFFPDAELAAE